MGSTMEAVRRRVKRRRRSWPIFSSRFSRLPASAERSRHRRAEFPPMKPMPYTPSPTRYETMLFTRCGKSGLKLPAISLGLWHNFGFGKSAESKSAIWRRAFDLGVTHFGLAHHYG